ncbi:hypothetical protein PUN28_004849 [Cardiocondyla obscurior]|uniref:Uncharacterized protein n=1 Tax=Cardiocondyla obscurior TaxID=286306 RepID=A0AAW2GHZ4_9HYME
MEECACKEVGTCGRERASVAAAPRRAESTEPSRGEACCEPRAGGETAVADRDIARRDRSGISYNPTFRLPSRAIEGTTFLLPHRERRDGLSPFIGRAIGLAAARLRRRAIGTSRNRRERGRKKMGIEKFNPLAMAEPGYKEKKKKKIEVNQQRKNILRDNIFIKKEIDSESTEEFVNRKKGFATQGALYANLSATKTIISGFESGNQYAIDDDLLARDRNSSCSFYLAQSLLEDDRHSPLICLNSIQQARFVEQVCININAFTRCAFRGIFPRTFATCHYYNVYPSFCYCNLCTRRKKRVRGIITFFTRWKNAECCATWLFKY